MKKTYITSILAHIDHGKTTLIDSLLATNNVISSSCAGDIRYMDSRTDEQTRGITLKLSLATVKRQIKDTLNKYIIIDTPGHVDFESLIQIASFISPSFILIIDVNEGITPRIFSLISHIRTSKTLLVLNKLDKSINDADSISLLEDVYYHLLGIISKLNDLIGTNVFDWDADNVVIAWSTMCAGISKSDLVRTINNGELMNGIKLFFELKKRIATGNVDKIMKRYNITKKGEKNIWMGVMPLANAILNGIERINDGLTADSALNNKGFRQQTVEDNENTKETALSDLQLHAKINDTVFLGKRYGFFGLSMYAMLSGSKLVKENLLFVTRVFAGKVSVGDTVKCRNKQTEKNVVIEKIMIFENNELVEVGSISEPTIVVLQGDFIKQSIMYKKHTSKSSFDSRRSSATKRGLQKYDEELTLEERHSLGNLAKDIEENKLEHIQVIRNEKDTTTNICPTKLDENRILDVLKNLSLVDPDDLLNDLVAHFDLTSKPFYKSYVTLKNECKESFVTALKVMSFLEPVFKVKINKFGNFEIFCEGKVQFEKIANDLEENGFAFEVKRNTKVFAETAMLCSHLIKDNIFCATMTNHVEYDNPEYKRILQALKKYIVTENPNESKEEHFNCQYESFSGAVTGRNYNSERISETYEQSYRANSASTMQKTLDKEVLERQTNKESLELILKTCKNIKSFANKTNTIYYYENKHKDIVISVFEQITTKGTLIGEKMHDIQFVMLINESFDDVDVYQHVKKHLLMSYTEALPIIIPFYYQCKIKSLPGYISQVYATLNKYYHVLQDELFDEKTEFYVLTTLVPQFIYYQFVEDIRMKSKGTVYLEPEEYGFLFDKKVDFTFLVSEIKKEKGMFVEEKIVGDPEKQRTLKK